MNKLFKSLKWVKKVVCDDVIDEILMATDKIAQKGTIYKIISLVIGLFAIYIAFFSSISVFAIVSGILIGCGKETLP